MSTLVIAEPVTLALLCPDLQARANQATCVVLDAEISTLKARLAQRSANAATVCGLVRDDIVRQMAWLQESLDKLQIRRDALC